MTNETDALLSEILRAENAYELLSPNIENEMRGAEGRESEEIEKQWTLIGNALFSARSHLAGLKAADDWIKAQPHETYDGLKRQFSSLKSMVNSMGQQLAHYQKKSYETGEKHLAELKESLESERAMNAMLTEELTSPARTPTYDPNLSAPDEIIDAAKAIRRWAENNGLKNWRVMGIGPCDVTSPAQGITAEEAREALARLDKCWSGYFTLKEIIRRALQSFVPEPEILSIHNGETP